MKNKMGTNISILTDSEGNKKYLYKKVSNTNPPLWGLTKNRIDQLNSSEYDYVVQFDFNEKSVILSSEQIKELINTKYVAGDGDYKIHLADIKPYMK